MHTGLAVRAALAAVPYLLRQQRWDEAAALLEDAFGQDPSRATVAAVWPAIQQVTRHDPSAAGILAKVLTAIDPAAADAQFRAYIADAVARGDYRTAAAAAGQLIVLYRDGGRLAEALDLAGQSAEYTRRPAWPLVPAGQRGAAAAGTDRNRAQPPGPRRGQSAPRSHGHPSRP